MEGLGKAGHVRAYKSITERWRQADAQDLLTSQSSEMGGGRSRFRGRPCLRTEKLRQETTTEDACCKPLSPTCIHVHVQLHMSVRMHRYTLAHICAQKMQRERDNNKTELLKMEEIPGDKPFS